MKYQRIEIALMIECQINFPIRVFGPVESFALAEMTDHNASVATSLIY